MFIGTSTTWHRLNVLHALRSNLSTIQTHRHRAANNCMGLGWWSGVVVSALALINKVNQRRARLVLRWATVSGFNSRCRTFILVCNQPATKANSAVHPSRVGKRVPASAGKAKAGMVHSVSGWTRGAQVKLWDPLRTRAIPERLRGMFTTRRYTNPRLPYLTLGRLTLLPSLGWYREYQLWMVSNAKLQWSYKNDPPIKLQTAIQLQTIN